MEKEYLNKDYAIVLDSTTFVDDDIKDLVRIEKVPMYITLGKETRKEPEWTVAEIEERYDREEAHTSCPAPHDFLVEFNRLFDDGIKDLIVLPMAKDISGTFQSAVVAKESLPEERRLHVRVLDSNVANFGVSNLIVAIKDDLKAKMPAADIYRHLVALTDSTKQIWTLGSLKYLYNGGRLSRLSFLVGTVLRIKPIIGLSNEDGKLHVEKKVRTFSEVDNYFLSQIREMVASYAKVYIRFINLGEEDQVINFREKVLKEFPGLVATSVSEVGPLFTIHLGRNGYGFTAVGDKPLGDDEHGESKGFRKLFDKLTGKE